MQDVPRRTGDCPFSRLLHALREEKNRETVFGAFSRGSILQTMIRFDYTELFD